MTQPLHIGSTVRITTTVGITSMVRTPNNQQQPQFRTISRRAILATLPDDDDNDDNDGHNNKLCTLLLEDTTPRPLIGPFLVAPSLMAAPHSQEWEIQVPISDILPLLTFERPEKEDEGKYNNDDDDDDATANHDTVESYKNKADELLRQHDYAYAISYYEAALRRSSSRYHVGSTLVVRRKGHCVIAELDCIETEEEEDDSRYDVTYVLPVWDILLVVGGDPEEGKRRGKRDKTSAEKFVQPRILLNLCRCLLRLAEIDADASSSSSSSSSFTNNHRISYRKAAVLGASIAITLCEYHSNHTDAGSPTRVLLASLLEKARIVRSTAFLELGKFPNALADVKWVHHQNQSHREAAELWRDIQYAEKYKRRADKRLSRDVCRWVQSATGGDGGG
ncbi:hypothetical protein HJC23_010843 [Cyclotella cryptica]|uniref:Uncharacterized protein n=1 Tax=Cyclotella cryptica TaxID=29204 RepID=A0ABD3QPN8_9STRA